MGNYETILFDLDGTLTDPELGITKSVQHSLKYFGIIENNLDNLVKFIGPPLKESFQEYYSFTEEQSITAVEKYREYFSVSGMYENAVYPMIPELLEDLISYNKRLIIATSKPTFFADKILKYFNLDKYFEFISGSNLDGSRVKKSEVILHAIEECKLELNEKMVMIGDRKHDLIGAREVGIASIGILYGYGSVQELQKEHPTVIVDSVLDLGKILLS
ncbi:MAG: HAD family hydrolase [Thermincolia bacterium]